MLINGDQRISAVFISREQKRRLSKPALALVLTSVMLLAGCENLAYYSRAAGGQLSLIWNRQSIERVMADKNTDPLLKQQLRLVQEARAFASDQLLLPVGGNFSHYVDTGRPYVVWNVYGAGEFSVNSKTWCYPIAGCVGYRGYFSEQAAQEKARELQEQGYETHVGGVAAYSTLGWFDDPVLNTFAFHKPDRLVSLIFHESAHKKLYVKDDTLFNESFATAVEQEGLHRWQARHSGSPPHQSPEVQWSQQLNLLLMRYRERLATLYGSELAISVKRKRKKQIFLELHQSYSNLKTQLGMDQRYDAWMSTINNAKLATVSDYHRFVPAFARMMAQAGSLSAFYSEVSQLAAQDRNSRHKQLEQLLMESSE